MASRWCFVLVGFLLKYIFRISLLIMRIWKRRFDKTILQWFRLLETDTELNNGVNYKFVLRVLSRIPTSKIILYRIFYTFQIKTFTLNVIYFVFFIKLLTLRKPEKYSHAVSLVVSYYRNLFLSINNYRDIVAVRADLHYNTRKSNKYFFFFLQFLLFFFDTFSDIFVHIIAHISVVFSVIKSEPCS